MLTNLDTKIMLAFKNKIQQQQKIYLMKNLAGMNTHITC